MDCVWDVAAIIVELTNVILCYTQILQMELCDKKRRVAMVYIGTLLVSVLYLLYRDEEWAIFFEILIVCIAVVFAIKGKKLKTILLCPCAYMLESAVCIMCSYIVAMILNVPNSMVVDNKKMVVLIGTMISLIIGLKYLYDKMKRKKYLKMEYTKLVYIAITIGSISFMFILGAVQSIGKRYNVPYNQTNFLGFLLSCVCMIFFCLFLWLSRTIYKNNTYQREKDMMNLHMLEQEKYIKLVVEKDIAMRRFRHDVKDHMGIISAYIEKSEYSEAKEYIDKMYETFSESQLIRYTGITAVDAVISEKKRYMDEQAIKFNWEGSICEFPLRLEIFDMCTLFTNILNNAIEACESLEADERSIEMTVSIGDDKVYIKESNVLKNDISFDESGNPVSIKGDTLNHGYGSKNIRAVVEKYNGELGYKTEKGIFTIEIIV